jgi:cobalamin transport system substrate-binding protein
VKALTPVASAVLAACALTALAACGSPGSSSQPSAQSSTPAPGGGPVASSSTPAAAQFPVTISAPGGPVTIKAQPERIVSLSPTATEDLFAVGAGKQVVAVDLSSNYPAGVPKTSLNGVTPNVEAIAGYSPSLVVTDQDANGLVAGMKKLGVPVLVEPAAASVDEAYAQITQIGQATGHLAGAQDVVAGMRANVAADLAKAGTAHSDLSYFWEVSANPYYSATSKTFAGSIAAMFGLKDIADAAAKAADGGYPQLTPEYILSAKPQIIFLTDNQATDGGQTPAVVAARPGWSAIPAVKNHEVIAMNDDVAARWGPRLPLLVAEIAAAVESAAGK